MKYTLQELSDKLELQELAYEYSEAIDQKQFDRLDEVFIPDAHIDYTALGGPEGNYAEIKKFLSETLPMFDDYYHMVTNQTIKIDGDTATGRVMCFNPMGLPVPDKQPQIMFLGLYYLDKYVRTDKGWRIAERVEERSWSHNTPEGIAGS